MAGSFTMTGGNMTNVFLDVNDAGATSGGLSGGSGYISGIDQVLGIGDMYLSVGGYSPHFVFCLVNPNEIFVMGIDSATSTPPILGGRLLATGAPGSFSQSSLAGNYLVHISGSSSGTAVTTLGLVTANSGALSGTLYQYDGTAGTTQTISGAAYSVDPTSGRTTLTNAGANPLVVYIASTQTEGVNAFAVGTDLNAEFGLLESSGGPFATSTLAGAWFFGTEDPSDNQVTNTAGVLTVASNGNFTGTEDASGSGSPALQAGLSISGTVSITNANGIGNVGPNTVAITNGAKLFFIDETRPAAAIVVVEHIPVI
jgi:hypothetical protein